MREHYSTTTVEEVATQIVKATKFTKLDARHDKLLLMTSEKLKQFQAATYQSANLSAFKWY